MNERHFMGKPCVRCGNVIRYVRDKRCVRCRYGRARLQYARTGAETRRQKREERILANLHRVLLAIPYVHHGQPGFLLERSDGSIFAWVAADAWREATGS